MPQEAVLNKGMEAGVVLPEMKDKKMASLVTRQEFKDSCRVVSTFIFLLL